VDCPKAFIIINMTIIDQRILIPAGPEVVWEIISDVNNNPRWQVDCQSVSFLNSLRTGPGMRWRYTSPTGQEFVVETSAWYDRLGYEYTYIDGAPFRTSKGTIRLQEIAEGTIVQWTLTYEIGGVLGGMRNSLGVRRHFNKLMVDSLKGLWTYLKESGKARQSHEAKSLMRDALDYEARAQYTPRHPSRASEREAQEPVQAPVPAVEEPPVSDDDTRPNPALVTEPEAAAPAEEPQPEAPEPKADIRSTDEWRIPSAEPELTRFQRPPVPEPPMPLDTPSKPLEPVTDEPAEQQPAPETDVQPPAEPEPLTAATVAPPAEQPAPEPAAPAADFGPKIDTSKVDTREISIWEVFGVLSPSDTERIKAVSDEQLAAADQPEPNAVETPADAVPVVAESPRLPVSGEETRPISIAPDSPQTPAVLVPGFRVFARRRRVRLRRRA
jgi:uncharacterized membrane protein